MDTQENLEQVLNTLETLRENDPEAYTAGLKELNATLQNYNEKVAALITKLES